MTLLREAATQAVEALNSALSSMTKYEEYCEKEAGCGRSFKELTDSGLLPSEFQEVKRAIDKLNSALAQSESE